MAPNPDEQPFLKYSDDDAASEEAGQPSRHRDTKASKRRWKALSPIVSHSLVFVLTSLLWIFVIPTQRLQTHHSSGTTAMTNSDHHSPGTANTGVAAGAHNHNDNDSKTHSSVAMHNATSGTRFLDCGRSTAEAQAKGCQYDMLLNHWIPQQCTDQEWIENYVEDGTWYAYRDEGRKQKVPSVREMSEMDHYFTSTRDHVNHCVVLWRKQFVALFEQKNLDSIISSWGHTEHCSQFLLDVTDKFAPFYEEPIEVQVGWAGCYVRQ